MIKMGGGAPADPEQEYPVEQREGVTIISMPPLETDKKADEFSNRFTTYNRTILQDRVTLLIAMCQMVREVPPVKRVILVGQGEGGLPALLAASAADAVAADCNGLDPSSDEALLVPGLFVPGLRCIGSFQGAAMLAAPHRLFLHNTQGKFPTADIEATYHAAGAEGALQISATPKTPEEIQAWAEQK